MIRRGLDDSLGRGGHFALSKLGCSGRGASFGDAAMWYVLHCPDRAAPVPRLCVLGWHGKAIRALPDFPVPRPTGKFRSRGQGPGPLRSIHAQPQWARGCAPSFVLGGFAGYRMSALST